MIRRPRSDVVLKQFLAGRDTEIIAVRTRPKDADFGVWLKEVEDALRRAMLKSEKRRKR